jgi:hypothetical protein
MPALPVEVFTFSVTASSLERFESYAEQKGIPVSSIPVPPASARELQFHIRITHDPVKGAKVVLNLVPTVFVEPIDNLRDLGRYFLDMADWAEWQPTTSRRTRPVSVRTHTLEEILR